MKLSRRITIRLSQVEYDKITAYCTETDIGYSQLFMTAIADTISGLPARNWQAYHQTYGALVNFHETLDFYKNFDNYEGHNETRIHDRWPN